MNIVEKLVTRWI